MDKNLTFDTHAGEMVFPLHDNDENEDTHNTELVQHLCEKFNLDAEEVQYVISYKEKNDNCKDISAMLTEAHGTIIPLHSLDEDLEKHNKEIFYRICEKTGIGFDDIVKFEELKSNVDEELSLCLRSCNGNFYPMHMESENGEGLLTEEEKLKQREENMEEIIIDLEEENVNIEGLHVGMLVNAFTQPNPDDFDEDEDEEIEVEEPKQILTEHELKTSAYGQDYVEVLSQKLQQMNSMKLKIDGMKENMETIELGNKPVGFFSSLLAKFKNCLTMSK